MNILNESARMVWARKKNKIVRKYRCSSGPRKNRLVNDPTDCSKSLNLKKKYLMKRLLARQGNRMRRIAKRTKRINPVSRIIQRMNKV